MRLLWRHRPLAHFAYKTNSRRWSSSKATDPLRILFCGSDQFSIASLRALHAERIRDPQQIASIDVVHRPGKRTGRGRETLLEVPIKAAAHRLELPRHEIDTFTGWTPPIPYNLVVAVSFGLFVPPRILNAAEYGGLNVHPSLLPDLYGPAPIHHTLLKKRGRTGITIQTLHQEHFDKGRIVSQTPRPGLEVPNGGNCTPSQLVDYLGPIGGQYLVDVLRKRSFPSSAEDAGWYGKDNTNAIVEHAGKITQEDMHIDFKNWTAQDILDRSRLLGDLWCELPFYSKKDGLFSPLKRVLFHEFELVDKREREDDIVARRYQLTIDPSVFEDRSQMRGLPKFSVSNKNGLMILTSDDKFLKVVSCTIAGRKKGYGIDGILSSLDADVSKVARPLLDG